MKFIETPIPGCYEIYPNIFHDDLGYYITTFHKKKFQEKGLKTDFAEDCYEALYFLNDCIK